MTSSGKPERTEDHLSPDERRSLDELSDRLIDKREKYQYFIVTAATAVTVFTFNDANAPTSALQVSPWHLPVIGWLFLVVASGLSLFGIWRRHDLNWTYLSMRYEGLTELPAARAARRDDLVKTLRRIQFWVAVLFAVGVLVLAVAYSAGMWSKAGSQEPAVKESVQQ